MSEPLNQKMTLGTDVYHQLLAQHDIYFIAFDKQGAVIASNYPVANLSLQSIDDLVFLAGPENIAHIKHYLDNTDTAVNFSVANLKFTMSTIPSSDGSIVYCLNIQASQALSQEANLGSIEKDYQIIQDLSESLNVISQAEGGIITDEQREQIRVKLLPDVELRLKEIRDPSLKLCLELVQTNLTSLLSGEQGMNQKLLEVLTPSEMQVAEFIRSGMSSQEIANNLNVARKTVENHRNSLRNKLGIKNRGVNLRNYLLSLEQ
ncbi:helix-turn-helix domain-containing protein [Vibrio mexicanus]|uniref:helix-turn-helix domain-containing protein n=1 Tax=Vibrio mexicanus TaxID=1004326 RepID=UPI00063C2041